MTKKGYGTSIVETNVKISCACSCRLVIVSIGRSLHTTIHLRTTMNTEYHNVKNWSILIKDCG
jgi:hypothetical protein